MSFLAFEQKKDTLEQFLQYCHISKFKRNRQVLIEEEVGTLFYVISGNLIESIANNESDNDVILRNYERDDFFWNGNFFENNLENFALQNIIVNTDSQIAKITHSKFKELRVMVPGLFGDIMMLINSQLSKRLQKMDVRVSNMIFLPAYERARQTIKELSQSFEAMSHPDGNIIKLSRKDLGRYIGCTREMAGRVTRELERDKFIKVNGMSILVYN